MTRFRRVLVASLILLLAPSILFAHARLIGSRPNAGERLAVSPPHIRLLFSETPMVNVSRILLLGIHGDTIRLGPVRVDPADAHAILADLIAPLDSGRYMIHWSTAGRDGHPERGGFWFTVLGSAAVEGGIAGDTAAEIESAAETVASNIPLTIARWLGFLALFSVIGAVSFRYAILGRLDRAGEPGDPFFHIASVGAATFGLFASIALVIATLIKLYGETVAMGDVPADAILLTTGWGWAWSVQMAACILAVVGFVVAHRNNGTGWRIALLSAVVLAVTPAATGHAIASDEATYAVPLDILHVLAGSAWLGTLTVILLVGIGAAAKTPGTITVGSRVARLINAFSPLALICGATVVATGVIASLLHLEPLSSLWTSGYGRVLIVKLALVSLLFVLGAWNWRRVKPRLGGDEGVKALQLSARLELVVAAIVLAVTAVLVAVPLPD